MSYFAVMAAAGSLPRSPSWRGTCAVAIPRAGQDRCAPWLVSWLQVSPLALILLVLFALPTVLFLVVSFFDYDRVGIYPAFMLRQLPRPADHAGDAARLSQFAEIRGHRLGDHAVPRLQHRLVPDLPRPQRHDPHGAVPAVRHSVLDVRHHPHHRLDSLPGPQRCLQHDPEELHITSQPLEFLLFSDFAVIVTYVHLFTLLMVGPIANSLAKIDPALLEAARDAGASRWRTMVDVVIPLSKTGIALGSILVFTQVMGDYFVVKQMSGGQSASIVSMLSTEIQAMQYPPASANAMVLVVFVAVMVAVHDAGRRCAQGTGEVAP